MAPSAQGWWEVLDLNSVPPTASWLASCTGQQDTAPYPSLSLIRVLPTGDHGWKGQHEPMTVRAPRQSVVPEPRVLETRFPFSPIHVLKSLVLLFKCPLLSLRWSKNLFFTRSLSTVTPAAPEGMGNATRRAGRLGRGRKRHDSGARRGLG